MLMWLTILLGVLFCAVLLAGPQAFGGLCAAIVVVQGCYGTVVWRRNGR